MSIWYEIKDPDNIYKPEDQDILCVCISDDVPISTTNGNVWIEIPIELIKKIINK